MLLLETMLAFPDKETLVEGVARALPVGGRFAFTLEEGLPLTESERARMPDADTVWLTPLDEMHGVLARNGLVVRWQDDWSRSHRAVADSLIAAFAADATDIASRIGRRALDELLAAHRLWSEWLATGRVRKIALVAERPVIAAAVAAVALTRGPVAESVTQRSAIISFRTAAPDHAVRDPAERRPHRRRRRRRPRRQADPPDAGEALPLHRRGGLRRARRGHVPGRAGPRRAVHLRGRGRLRQRDRRTRRRSPR